MTTVYCEKDCAECGWIVDECIQAKPVLSFIIIMASGNEIHGRFHNNCEPPDFDAWAAKRLTQSL